MSDQAATAAAEPGRPLAATRERDRFFLIMSAALLAILLIGFAPTLYFRVIFDPPPIPFYLHLHGVVVTSWFVWVVFQSSLVNVGRPDVHRRVGMAGFLIALGVLIMGPMATLRSVARLPEQGFTLDPPFVTFMGWVVSLNTLMIVGFVGL